MQKRQLREHKHWVVNMPWKTKKVGDKYVIYKPDTGKVVGKSVSKALAQASVRARYANYKGKK